MDIFIFAYGIKPLKMKDLDVLQSNTANYLFSDIGNMITIKEFNKR